MLSHHIHRRRSLVGTAALVAALVGVVAGVAIRDAGPHDPSADADRAVAAAAAPAAALRTEATPPVQVTPAAGRREAGMTAASGGSESTSTTIRVESEFKDPGELTDVQRARCGLAQPGACEVQLGGHSTLTGTMNGWTDYATWGHADADGSTSYYSRETFTGTVAGCGRGTFEFVVDDGRVDPGPSDQNPAARHLHGSWVVVPRSSTGDFVGLSAGHGQEDGLYYPDSSLSGAFTGDLACRR